LVATVTDPISCGAKITAVVPVYDSPETTSLQSY
jgi:hypothetical protein